MFVYGISDRNRSVCLCMVYQMGIGLCVSVFVYGISDRNISNNFLYEVVKS